ncbi:HNH endonuclease signature motif containing protein, partial [Haloactinopolyspora alba]|uniref:HNH endonuclease signature motif containing protein n=1 Tax=Haloactinopolyspora alba TaxID=648780 RepID=UPI00197A9749
TVGLSTLTGLDEHPGHLDGYGPIPADVARHLSTAGIWQWVGTNDVTGAAVSHGRGRYTPTRDLIDHVILRDHTCRAPGCHTPAQHCDLDHTIVYPLGGTDACNLGLFCRHHHLLKHHTRWRVEQPHPGTFVWTSPTGRTTT